MWNHCPTVVLCVSLLCPHSLFFSAALDNMPESSFFHVSKLLQVKFIDPEQNKSGQLNEKVRRRSRIFNERNKLQPFFKSLLPMRTESNALTGPTVLKETFEMFYILFFVFLDQLWSSTDLDVVFFHANVWMCCTLYHCLQSFQNLL